MVPLRRASNHHPLGSNWHPDWKVLVQDIMVVLATLKGIAQTMEIRSIDIYGPMNRGHDELPTQTRHTYNRKSLKITIDFKKSSLISAKMVI